MQNLLKNYAASSIMRVGLAVILITVFTAGLVAFYIHRLATEEIQEHLQSTLNDSIFQLKTQFKEQKSQIKQWAQNPTIVSLTERLIASDHPYLETSLRKELDYILNAQLYFDYKIVGLDGHPIFTGKDEVAIEQNQTLLDASTLQALSNGNTLISLPFIAKYPRKDKQGQLHNDMVLMMLMSAIRDHLGNAIAVLVIEFDPDPVILPIFHHNQVGRTGETYAIDENGLLLTHIKFTDQLTDIGMLDPTTSNPAMRMMMRDPGINLLETSPPLPENIEQQPLTVMAQSLSKKESGMDLNGYRDYRGVDVVGVWKWDDELQMGFVTETDTKEAFALYNLMALSILFGVTFVVVAVIIVMMIYRQSSQKQLAEIQLRDSMVNHSADGIILVNSDFVIQIVNPALCKLFGYSEEELVGQAVEILLPDEMREQHARVSKNTALQETKVFDRRRELEGYSKEGRRFPIDLTITPMAMLEQRYFIGIIRDITDKINNDRSLVAAKVEAEAARAEAEEANRAKSEFLSKMSHELRTPLNAILGFAQLLELDELSTDQNESVSMIKKAGAHLLNLINDILNLARIESGNLSLSLEHVELRTLISDLLPLVKEQLKTLELSLNTEYSVDDKIWVRADHLRLKQVVLNLLTNAIKYNRNGGSINIVVSQRTHSIVRISVQDTGYGLDQKQLSHLFEPFNRLNASDTIEGTGIGLVISRELLKLMGGNIGVESVKDVGSTFWIELNMLDEHKLEEPMEKSSTTSAQGQLNNDETPSTVSVLYVEDNPANLMVVRQLLKRYPQYQLTEAMSAEAGLDMIRQKQPDIVLMDINLPGMSGFDALEVIKNEGLNQSMKVIALSANAMTTQVTQGIEAGFDEYLTKPIDFALLMETLDKLSK